MFTPIWGYDPSWVTNIFQMGWNHQPVTCFEGGFTHLFVSKRFLCPEKDPTDIHHRLPVDPPKHRRRQKCACFLVITDGWCVYCIRWFFWKYLKPSASSYEYIHHGISTWHSPQKVGWYRAYINQYLGWLCHLLLGGGFKYLFIFTSKIREDEPILILHLF